MKEYHLKYRPTELDDVVGQPEAVKTIGCWLQENEVPHSILFSGASGCGKTTLARILRVKLGCKKSDLAEVNCADLRGIDNAREIRSLMNIRPAGKCRVWILDEVHRTSKDFQDAMLKLLEDTPEHVYFMLCTTDPHKLLKTIITRCTEVRVRPLSEKDMRKVLGRAAKLAKKSFSDAVLEKVIDCADGSPRKALVLLNAIASLKNESDQLAGIEKADHKSEAIQIARALLNPRMRWPEMAKLLKTCDLDDAEGLRQLILSYCTTVLLSGGPLATKAAEIIEVFRDALWDSRKFGLIANCYGILGQKR